jgi:hypothetical protein
MLKTHLGCKCLLAGGLYAQMAREDGVEDLVILRSPRTEAGAAMIIAADVRARGYAYVDNVLTEAEIAVITGVMAQWGSDDPASLVAKGKQVRVVKSHFWPALSTWHAASTGLNWGEWMPRNEKWYRDRQDQYGDGKFQKAYNNVKWRNKIAGNVIWKRMRDYHEHWAEEMLKDIGLLPEAQ